MLGEVQDSDSGGLPAREVALRFENQHVAVYETLAVARVQDDLMAFTLSRVVPFDADAEAFWSAVKSGVQPGA